jgi:hypothetical protein
LVDALRTGMALRQILCVRQNSIAFLQNGAILKGNIILVDVLRMVGVLLKISAVRWVITVFPLSKEIQPENIILRDALRMGWGFPGI